MTRLNLHTLPAWRLAVAVALLVSLYAAPGILQAHHSEVTTSIMAEHPFQVPGETLEANTTYTLRVHPSSNSEDRHVIEILDEQENHTLSTFLGVSEQQRSRAGADDLTFIQTGRDYAAPVKSWTHQEWATLAFVYPEQQAREIAENTAESILTTGTRVNAQTEDLAAIQVTTMEGRGAVQTAENIPQEGALPRTASPLPLWAAVGLLCLGLGLALRRVRSA